MNPSNRVTSEKGLYTKSYVSYNPVEGSLILVNPHFQIYGKGFREGSPETINVKFSKLEEHLMNLESEIRGILKGGAMTFYYLPEGEIEELLRLKKNKKRRKLLAYHILSRVYKEVTSEEVDDDEDLDDEEILDEFDDEDDEEFG